MTENEVDLMPYFPR
jgi:quercetin dioxygenase-like cupin family protein